MARWLMRVWLAFHHRRPLCRAAQVRQARGRKRERKRACKEIGVDRVLVLSPQAVARLVRPLGSGEHAGVQREVAELRGQCATQAVGVELELAEALHGAYGGG